MSEEKDYVKFINAWKKAYNHPNNKKRTIPVRYIRLINNYSGTEIANLLAQGWVIDNDKIYFEYPGRYQYILPWLTPAHHVLRNVFLKKPLHYGFLPLSKNKSNRYGTFNDPWSTLILAILRVDRYITMAHAYKTAAKSLKGKERWNLTYKSYGRHIGRLKNESYDEYHARRYLTSVNDFLMPYDGAVTLDMLHKLKINSDYKHSLPNPEIFQIPFFKKILSG